MSELESLGEQSGGVLNGARTVRDATFDVMRHYGMTRIFGNPGSSEIPFLASLPSDLEFILGLHEGAVVGMATGYATGTGRPAFVNLHTAPGLGNAINAIANARDNRVPLVVVVGQQDRRHLALSPFLTGRALERVAGEYPVWSNLPVRPQDVPGAIARAWHEAMNQRGPALVVVPMGDWAELADEDITVTAPARVLSTPAVNPNDIAEMADLIEDASSPTIVVGAGAAGDEAWKALVALAEKLDCPVWQDPFCNRPGFPQDHPLFAGHLHWARPLMRKTLAPHDLVLTAGTWAFRGYMYEPGPMVEPGTRIAVISDDPEEVHRSPADLALLGSVADACAGIAERVQQRSGNTPEPFQRPAPLDPPAAGEPLRAGHVLCALAERLPTDVVLMEEAPSTRPELLARIPARTPWGFVSVANGALGYGMSGTLGLALSMPDRPVLAVLGDGSSMYTIQTLWSAAHYHVGALIIVLSNGRYAVMDMLAREAGEESSWPPFQELDIAAIARGLGCPAKRIDTHDELLRELDDEIPNLASRSEPLLLEIVVAPE
ncbi:MAG TPA: thiamine pyrophosphate-binding protein [Thermoleophilaceae bacterium]|nr:thiamine pyrophosphate-binding protein [Thermoleophilaceae bacterium]